MKLTKKILLFSSIFAMGAATTLSLSKVQNVVKAEENERIVLPSSITSSIYRYAKAIGDTALDVDNALAEWLNADDNLSSLAIFESIPDAHNEVTNREVKDAFYVIAYVQQYITIGTCNSKYSTQPIRQTLDDTMSMIDTLYSFIDSENENDLECAYFDCQCLYECLRNVITYFENDVYSVFNKPVEAFVSNAKRYLKKTIEQIESLGFDESLNKYSYFKSALNGFGAFTYKNVEETDKYSSKILDYILFDENSPIDTYLTSDFLDFDLSDYQLAVEQAGVTEREDVEEFSAPYLEKIDRQLTSYLITYNFALSYIDDEASISKIIHNCGPLMYKVLELVEAKYDNDCPNIVILSFNIMEDYEMLLGELNLKTNQKDLKYEKYIANLRLGSLAYEDKNPYKFAKYLDNIEKIDAVSLEEKTYEEGVEEINSLVTKGYENLNTDIIPNSDLATLMSVDGLEAFASREQKYSLEVRKAVDNHASLFEEEMQKQYRDNFIYANVIYIDMLLTDKNTNQNINRMEGIIDVTLEIDGLENSGDIKVFRYDEAKDEINSLHEDGSILAKFEFHYYCVDSNKLTIHVKNFGTYAIAFINNDVKQGIESIQEQISTLNTQVSSKDATIAELQSKIEELEEQIEALEMDKTVKQSTIDSLQTELNDVKASLNEKIVEIQNIESSSNSKNALSIIFIILTCLFLTSTAVFAVLYLRKNKREQQ